MSIELSADDRLQGYLFSFSYQPAIYASARSTPAEGRQLGSAVTVMDVLGYIPGVSLIVGIARMIFSQVASMLSDTKELSESILKEVKAIQEAQLVRGALECCSIFAPLILITDIMMTLLMKSKI